ncbi:hydrogenase maturation protease [Spongiactinospora sp. TRM90649]|uniref:hydrogenase maturation protease n=1 Tax=Spongiactinospora sp. TRM90649 TaxID=3031114 RepID=UPI0023F7706E|nr:hydrogenase maturation protease [Spongiactinospora sp. TRM90649]MDF5755200.1 hydrogenase maturation protease [Spongiactinospora sp. TRM90649]
MPAERVVIGLGSDARGDDAAGLEVVRRLLVRAPAGVLITESSGDPMHLISTWSGTRLAIVIDAVSSGAPPGTVHHDIDPRRAQLRRGSTHALGLTDALDLATALGLLPGRLLVYGIEGGDFSVQGPITPPVRTAIRETAVAIRARLNDAAG